jgi:hypothetical protein
MAIADRPWPSTIAISHQPSAIDTFSEGNDVPVRIFDGEFAQAVELRHQRHHDLHRPFEPIVQCVDALHLDEHRRGRADRFAGEDRVFPGGGGGVVEKISTAPLVTAPKTNGEASGTVIPRVKPSMST